MNVSLNQFDVLIFKVYRLSSWIPQNTYLGVSPSWLRLPLNKWHER